MQLTDLNKNDTLPWNKMTEQENLMTIIELCPMWRCITNTVAHIQQWILPILLIQYSNISFSFIVVLAEMCHLKLPRLLYSTRQPFYSSSEMDPTRPATTIIWGPAPITWYAFPCFRLLQRKNTINERKKQRKMARKTWVGPRNSSV